MTCADMHSQSHLQEKSSISSLTLKRAFVRTVVRRMKSPALLYQSDAVAAASAAIAEAEPVLRSCSAELARLSTQSGGAVDWASVFVSVLPGLPLRAGAHDEAQVAAALRAAAAAAGARLAGELRAASVTEWTVRLRPRGSTSSSNLDARAWRVTVSLPSGHEAGEDTVGVYREELDSGSGQVVLAAARGAPLRSPHSAEPQDPRIGQQVLEHVPPLSPLQQRRLHARRHSTTYCYDFPAVFENALRAVWAAHLAQSGGAAPTGAPLVHSTELVLQDEQYARFADADSPLTQVARAMGTNSIGMVAWLLVLRTPEWPHGRQVLAVANDITHGAGAFGPREYTMFRAACDHAVQRGLPLVYLAANSGARVGLDAKLKQAIQARSTFRTRRASFVSPSSAAWWRGLSSSSTAARIRQRSHAGTQKDMHAVQLVRSDVGITHAGQVGRQQQCWPRL